MKFGIKSKKINRNFLLKLYFGVGSILILVIFILYSHILMENTKKEASVVPNLCARFVTFSTQENFNGLLVQYILEDIISDIDYPIMVTNEKKEPLFWKNLSIQEGIPFKDLNEKDKKVLKKKIEQIQKRGAQIPLSYNSDEIFGYAFFSESKTIKHLRYMPYLEMSLILLFVLFGVYGISFLKKHEKDMLWVGLAKETAHQFGTPISSLLAWSDVLKMRIENKYNDTEMMEMLDFMKTDVRHLQRVVNRFGKVGSTIKLQPYSIQSVIDETIRYFEDRLPVKDHKIVFHLISKLDDRMINIDSELIKWTMENLIKNCIDAMKLKGGNIIITAFCKEKWTYILIKDEGIGLPKSEFTKIFEPGVTSKKRGWGLGLSLAKRIIEDYHKGKIKVLESTINEGTTFEICLPD